MSERMVRKFWTCYSKQNKGSTSRGHGSPKFLIKFSINCFIPLVFNQILRVFLTLWLVNLSYMILCPDLTVSDSVYTYNIIAMYKLRNAVQKILLWFCDNTRMFKFLNLMSDEHTSGCAVNSWSSKASLLSLLWRKKLKY